VNTNDDSHQILHLLGNALKARIELFDRKHETAFRIFNGFYEGYPDLVVDLYAKTLVIYDHTTTSQAESSINVIFSYLRDKLPWLQAVILKTRKSPSLQARRGIYLMGTNFNQRINEHGLWYALDMLLNQDASLYLDTRNLRQWAIVNLAGKNVLNTFAYTGSLGVAALGGGAKRVVQVDLKSKYLNIAKKSYIYNGFPINNADFKVNDFFSSINHYKLAGELFDCAFLDPPIFSKTKKGTIDMVSNSQRVINKVRPLVRDGGYLVVINSALFLSGAKFMQILENMCSGDYLSIEDLIPIPPDITGYSLTKLGDPPVDPAPFNHSTKIVILRVRRKAEQIA
jgi:23S rRNA (cytosine1962-C5)-methyltransferase